jgi:hypothetical protein
MTKGGVVTATRDREPEAAPARPAGIAGPDSSSRDELTLLLEQEARLDARVERAHGAIETLRAELERREKNLYDSHRQERRAALVRLDEELDRHLEGRLEALETRAARAIEGYEEIDEATVARLAEWAVELLLRADETAGDEP